MPLFQEWEGMKMTNEQYVNDYGYIQRSARSFEVLHRRTMMEWHIVAVFTSKDYALPLVAAVRFISVLKSGLTRSEAMQQASDAGQKRQRHRARL